MEPAVTGLVCPAPDAHSFEVAGITYTQTAGLSVNRLRIFQRQGLEFGMDMRLRDVQQALATAKEQFNKGKHFDAILSLGKLMEGTDFVGANRLRDVEICALFYNAPDEDPGQYDFEAMQAKIAAWGAVHSGFFMLAALRLLSEPYGPYTLSNTAEPNEAPPAASAPLPSA